ncbi:MAG: N-acetylmuramoyl-L-alanine amidase-like domain-containing protein [Fimbriimonas sp.]
MTRRELLAATLAAAVPFQKPATGQEPRAFRGEDVLAKILRRADAEGWAKLPIGERMGRIGLAFADTKYEAFTLELWADREACIVNLRGLDCVTFFESSLGIARMLAKGRETADELTREVTLTRYRGGRLGNYASRLHYTCDWMHDNAQKGTVRLLTPDLPGAKRFDEDVYFMSQKPHLYRQLKAQPNLVPEIKAIEAAINARETFYVPTAQIDEVEPLLQTGDIVGITAGQKGIDCAHTGMCFRDADGVLRFLHAGQSAGRVLLDKRLSEYLGTWATGAMFVRPLEVRRS